MSFEGIKTIYRSNGTEPKIAPNADAKWWKISSEWMQRIVTAIPLGLVNAVAVVGQLSWASDHLRTWGLAGQLLFAFALESIALNLSYHAYLAEKSNDTALRLKIGSYALGLAVGILNYSHFAHDWKPTAVAIVVGGMSSLSPVLWGVYSRRVSRPILVANGLIESHGLRLGAERWVFHPIRSFRVKRHASWIGENKASKAIASYDRIKEAA